MAVGGTHEFADHAVSNGYVKPWRNVEAKVSYLIFNIKQFYDSGYTVLAKFVRDLQIYMINTLN